MKRARFAALGVGVVMLMSVRPAIADVKESCIDAHEQAQQLRNAGHLKAARKAMLACSRNECPALILADCRPWLNASRDELPSVIISVHDERGVETSEVRVLIDGETVATRLDGRPIDVDPGEHVLRFERPNLAPLEQHLFVRVGEHESLVSVAFPRSDAQSPVGGPHPVAHSGHSRWSTGVVISGLIGVAGLGVFAGFGISGKIEESHLASTCIGSCDAAQIADVRTQYIVAYASLGVGVVALGISIGLFVAAPTRSSAVALQWGLAPLPGGGAATVLGRF